MAIRTIKPQFFRSRKLSAVSRDARLTLIGLWTEADGHGRGIADPFVIKGALWPLDHDITPDTVEAHLWELVNAEQIVMYDVDGERFFLVEGWEKNQAANYRRGDPQHPDPAEGEICVKPTESNQKMDITPAQQEFARQCVQPALLSVLEGKGREGKGSSSRSDEAFVRFWHDYPRKVAKQDAARAWANMTAKERADAQNAIAAHAAHWHREGTRPEHIPYPASWLNGKRWTDDLGRAIRPKPQNGGVTMSHYA